MIEESNRGKGSFWALLPLILFIIIYFAGSIIIGDFYALPVLVVFVVSLFVALLQYPKKPFAEKLKHFSLGSGDENILIMIVIFLLAGAFGELSKAIGAISSTINFALTYISPSFIISGLFIVACFISTSLGTSVGTIVALVPVAVGFENYIPGVTGLAVAAVVGGAMFGDNLSFISDTTIAATRTQNIGMRDKFKVNFKIVLPIALIVFIIYYFQGVAITSEFKELEVEDYSLIKLSPYIVVFILALLGLHVVWTLGIGIVVALIIGLITESITFLESIKSINTGFAGMFELSILCLIIGGVVGIIRYNGGVDYLLNIVLNKIKSKRGAELGIASLTALVNFALANNTITIVIVGPIAKDISNKFNLDPKRVASILDTVSCFIQGILPYGAQILAALAASAVVLESMDSSMQLGPLDIMQYLYYPFLMGIGTLVFILLSNRKTGQS